MACSRVSNPPDATVPSDLSFLYNFGQLDFARLEAAFASIAQSLTADVRLLGETNYSAPANGTILVLQTIIVVQWEWLILPLALAFLTILFVIAVIFQTSAKGRGPLGKSFSLLMLLYGVAGQSPEEQS